MHPIFCEQPLRIFASAFVKRFSRSLRAQELWDTSDRPQYLSGILAGADQAVREGRKAITVVEFGVAGGRGLIAMQNISRSVEKETGVEIHVFGFDLGTGLASPRAGYKDHPDHWQEGDFPMVDRGRLESQFTERTSLVLGNVNDTVLEFLERRLEYPLGFVSFDLDYYSSTMAALTILSSPKKSNLIHTPLYFDDMFFFGSSDFAGERLAIREFNEQGNDIKIDPWHILPYGRPFPERRWLRGMYVANDMVKIENFSPTDKRNSQLLPL